ncbi:MAG: HD domain-containing protein [Candidatus Thiodiazotropha sp. (ex. Lucinisca nassula)]|nr:HD domain-containing protein [Candidatus Thiodiazotropha sp. (ex. Lucinisca nassula)]MBW9275316.1 HD domain-containing protein [Candidatus Thiodiazotropha sp. (ex. Lucinisca nassula)]
MKKIGTLKWVKASNGKLGLVDRLTLIAQGVKAKADTRRRITSGQKIRNMEVKDILPPDSPTAREAMAMCEEASQPFLFNHCLRSYFWARLLDDVSEPFDDEAVFTALMLHDMGLTDKYRLQDAEQQCFTIVGARMADELASKHNWSDKRASIAANAITLHLNVVIDSAHGNEARMVRAGSGGDVAGFGLDALHDDQIQAVCDKYPRLNMKRNMRAVIGIETKERPDCRIAFLDNIFAFRNLIAQAPMFSE